MSTELRFFYDTDGSLAIGCTDCEFRSTMMPDDLFPTDNPFLLKHTVDIIYFSIRHLRQHALRKTLEGPQNANDSSSVHS